MRNLEIQIRHLANALNNRPQGALPSDTQDARKNYNEQYKAVTVQSRTLIDVHKGELTMRMNDQHVTFNVFQALKCADETDECQVYDMLEFILRMDMAQLYHKIEDDASEVDIIEDESLEEVSKDEQPKPLGLVCRGVKAPKPLIEEPLELELK
ncbi:hypothetical protein V6N13_008089 [Hibiscus sabdariffa]